MDTIVEPYTRDEVEFLEVLVENISYFNDVVSAPVEPHLLVGESKFFLALSKGYISPRANVFMFQNGDDLLLSIYFSKEIRTTLADLVQGEPIFERNISNTDSIIEELSHYCFVNYAIQNSRKFNKLELELQGAIDKFFTLKALILSQNGVSKIDGLNDYLIDHVFNQKFEHEIYDFAYAHAKMFIDRISSIDRKKPTLKRFFRASLDKKIDYAKGRISKL